MNRIKQVSLALATAGMLASGVAQAGLESRAGGTMLYDDVLDITWLADANYARTSGYNSYQYRMDWFQATRWANTLVYGGYSDWRLPKVLDTGVSGCLGYANGGTDCGYNVQTVASGTVYSELAHMYHNNLGLKSKFNTSGVLQPDFGMFGNGTLYDTDGSGYYGRQVGPVKNLQPDGYWSGTPVDEFSDYSAWYFSTHEGLQRNAYWEDEVIAWAVRDGDVAAPIPEPETYAMMLVGLGLLGVVARRRKQKFSA